MGKDKKLTVPKDTMEYLCGIGPSDSTSTTM